MKADTAEQAGCGQDLRKQCEAAGEAHKKAGILVLLAAVVYEALQQL